MARKITRKELKQDEFVEAAVDFGKWLEQNWPKLLRWVGVVALVALLVIAWTAYSRQTRERAESRLSEVLADYDRMETAGFNDPAELDTLLVDLEEIAGSAGGTSAAVARLYLGSALFQLERYEDAEAELQRAISGAEEGSTLYSTANAVLANVLEASGRTEEAIGVLDSLLDGGESQVPKDQTLLQIGKIYDRAGRADEARESWQRVTDEYPNSMAAGEARRLLTQ